MIDTATLLFGVAATEAGIALVGVGFAFRYRGRAIKAEDILAEEQAEGAHFRELADDALANIEGLQAEIKVARSTAKKWADDYARASGELRRIDTERKEAAAHRAAHMRSIAAIGNRSPKRRKQGAVA